MLTAVPILLDVLFKNIDFSIDERSLDSNEIAPPVVLA